MKNDFIKTKTAANMSESTQLTMHTVPECHLLLHVRIYELTQTVTVRADPSQFALRRL